jgi:hypothetical protein
LNAEAFDGKRNAETAVVPALSGDSCAINRGDRAKAACAAPQRINELHGAVLSYQSGLLCKAAGGVVEIGMKVAHCTIKRGRAQTVKRRCSPDINRQYDRDNTPHTLPPEAFSGSFTLPHLHKSLFKAFNDLSRIRGMSTL